MHKTEAKYITLLNHAQAIEELIQRLPKGYISRKIINRRTYYYLQKREGKKVKSKYIKQKELFKVVSEISLRKDMQIRSSEICVELQKLRNLMLLTGHIERASSSAHKIPANAYKTYFTSRYAKNHLPRKSFDKSHSGINSLRLQRPKPRPHPEVC
ncbi:hypothetical protein EOM86_05385 [Candidatus Nomurabacteria bacterium]|nr:hypothetical protein [Candidatus Nomurabacteria bacterium]